MMDKEVKKEKIFIFATLFVFIALAIIKIIYHEPWRDEAQAWLLARDLNIMELFKNMKYEGHPILWHMLLKVLQIFKLPYVSEMILHALLNIIAVYLILAKIKMNKLLKILFVFSDIVAFEYLVIARSYVLILLIMVLIAIMYKNRFKNYIKYSILIILLANTSLHALGIATALTILYGFEIVRKYKSKEINKKDVILRAICITLILISITGILLMLRNEETKGNLSNKISYRINNDSMGLIEDGLNTYGKGFTGDIGIDDNIVLLLGFFMVIYGYMLFHKKLEILFIYIFSSGFLYAIFVFINFSGTRHAYLYVLIFMFCIWLTPYYEEEKEDALNYLILYATLFLLVIVGSINSYKDYINTFSDGRNLARFIKENNYEDYTIISYESAMISACLPYFENKQIWCIEDENYHTYMPWTDKFNHAYGRRQELLMELENTINRNFLEEQKVLLILDKRLNINFTNKLDLVYRSGDVLTNDEYNVYVYKERSLK